MSGDPTKNDPAENDPAKDGPEAERAREDQARDVSGHEADHAAGHPSGPGAPGHVPADPNDGIVRARPPSPFALLVTAVAATLTVLALVAVAVVSGQGT